MKKMINVKDLKVADVRYYDVEHNGMEWTKPLSKVVLLNRGDTYINVLNPGEFAPIYRRVPRTSNAYGNEGYFGTKIEQVCGEERTGEAWLLSDVDFKRIFYGEYVTIKDIEDYVLRSPDYYHNRAEVIEMRLLHQGRLSNRDIVAMVDTKVKDEHSKAEMDNFFAERGVKKVYSK